MRAVSVYRVSGVGDPSHVFGGVVRDAGVPHGTWLGWLPLTTVAFAEPDIALAEDQWLTALAGRSGGGRVRPDDLVSAVDAARELLARRASGLAAYTRRPGGDGLLWGSSVAVSVADDLSAQLDRVRSVHETLVECLGALDRELRGGCQPATPGGSLVLQRYARVGRELEDHCIRLHLLVDAAIRIGVFDPAAARR